MAVEAPERSYYVDIEKNIPRNPFPPHTTSFFCAAEAIAAVCGEESRKAKKFGWNARVVISLHAGQLHRADRDARPLDTTELWTQRRRILHFTHLHVIALYRFSVAQTSQGFSSGLLH